VNETAINWTDLTWNPATGCTVVSAECSFCYARTIAENKRGTPAFPNGFDVMVRPWKLVEPRRVKRPSLIFTNSMTDMFHEEIPDSYRKQVLTAMAASPQHRYQVLTKRPEAAERFFRGRPVPPWIWLGVTVGLVKTAHRIDVLRQIPARVRFLSCEPLLTSLEGVDFAGIDWVIGGGESGFHARDPRLLKRRFLVRPGVRGEARWMPRSDRIPWARALRDQTHAVGAAFWWKQWGGPTPGSGGRDLDGREWSEFPQSVPGAMPAL
jgi:protein gp37